MEFKHGETLFPTSPKQRLSVVPLQSYDFLKIGAFLQLPRQFSSLGQAQQIFKTPSRWFLVKILRNWIAEGLQLKMLFSKNHFFGHFSEYESRLPPLMVTPIIFLSIDPCTSLNLSITLFVSLQVPALQVNTGKKQLLSTSLLSKSGKLPFVI